jgi:hypothetical protein
LQLTGFGDTRYEELHGILVAVRGGDFEGRSGQHNVLFKNTNPSKNNPAEVNERTLKFELVELCASCGEPLPPARHARGAHSFVMLVSARVR